MNAKINTQMNVDEGSDPLSGIESTATVSNSANSPHLSAAGSSTLAAERPSRPPATWQQLSSGDSGTLTLMIVGPNGSKTPLKIRVSDDVSTLRALVTQMHDTADWTTQTDRREDRQAFSDWADEDAGFAEVIALEPKPHEQAIAPSSWRNPRTWLEWNDKRGKLRMMCGAYHLADGKPLSYYHIVDGSVIHPLYERYGDAIDAGAKMLIDPDWYMQQGQQARALATQASSYFGYSPSYFTTSSQQDNATSTAAAASQASEVGVQAGGGEQCSGKSKNGWVLGGGGGGGGGWILGGGATSATSSKFTEYFVWPGPLVDHTPSPKPDVDSNKTL